MNQTAETLSPTVHRALIATERLDLAERKVDRLRRQLHDLSETLTEEEFGQYATEIARRDRVK